MGFNSASSSINESISSSSSPSLVSSDLSDDASSSSNDSSNGPLYELAHDLMAQLPIKRGLSKFYNGKSQTFASLSNVRSVEDLGKKEMSLSRRMKSCKSFGGNLVNIQHKFGPKPTIAKRSPKTPSFSSFPTKSSFFIHG